MRQSEKRIDRILNILWLLSYQNLGVIEDYAETILNNQEANIDN